MFQRLALMQTACQALGALCSDGVTSSGPWLPLPGAGRRPGNNLVLPRALRTSGGSFQVVSGVFLHSQLIFGDISLAASELLTIPPPRLRQLEHISLGGPGSPALMAVRAPMDCSRRMVRAWIQPAAFMKLLLKIISHLRANACTLPGILWFLLSVCWAPRSVVRTYMFIRSQKLAFSFHQNVRTNH